MASKNSENAAFVEQEIRLLVQKFGGYFAQKPHFKDIAAPYNLATDTDDCDRQYRELRKFCLDDCKPYFEDLNLVEKNNAVDPTKNLPPKEEITDAVQLNLVKVRKLLKPFYKGGDCAEKYDGNIKYIMERTRELSVPVGLMGYDEKGEFRLEPKFRALEFFVDTSDMYAALPEQLRSMGDKDMNEVLNMLSEEESGIAIQLVEQLSTEYKFFKDLKKSIPLSTHDIFKFLLEEVYFDSPQLRLLFKLIREDAVEKLKSGKPLNRNMAAMIQSLFAAVQHIEKQEENLNKQIGYKKFKESFDVCELLIRKLEQFKTDWQIYSQSAKDEELSATRAADIHIKIKNWGNSADSKIVDAAHKKSVCEKLIAFEKHTNIYRTYYRERASYCLMGQFETNDESNINTMLEQLNGFKQSKLFEDEAVRKIASFSIEDLDERITDLEKALAAKKLPDYWRNNIKDYNGKKIFAHAPSSMNENAENFSRNPLAAGDNKKQTNLTAPDDVKQGELGDCYFLASIAALAKNPSFFYNESEPEKGVVTAVKDTKNPKKVDYYEVKLYLPLEGNPQHRTLVHVQVKPFLKPPFTANTADKGEIWVAIVERALAQIKGGYDETASGTAFEGLAYLLPDNKVPKNIYCDQTSEESLQEQLKNVANANKPLVLTSRNASELDPLMQGTDTKKPVNAGNGFQYTFGSLVVWSSHAYSVDSLTNAGGFRVRNPHGDVQTLTAAQIKLYFSHVTLIP